MLTRSAISALWFLAAFCLYELAWSLFGWPREFGLVIGIAAAAGLWIALLQRSNARPLERPVTAGHERGLQPR